MCFIKSSQGYNELVASRYDSVYATKFVVLRDRKILEKYLKLEMKKHKKLKY